MCKPSVPRSASPAAGLAAAVLALAAGANAQAQAPQRPALRAAVPVVTCPFDAPDRSPFGYSNGTGGYARSGRDPFVVAFCHLPDSLLAKSPTQPALVMSYRDFSAEGGKVEARLYRKSLATGANELIAVLPSTSSAALRVSRAAIAAAYLPLDATQYAYYLSVTLQSGGTAPNEAHLVGLGE
jgi:hypothetical protein